MRVVQYKRKLVYCLVNRVMMQDVARVVKIMGGNPIMSEEATELRDIIPHCKSILLNMGTPTAERFMTALTACQLATEHNVPVVLDPVGCNQTQFRLEENIKLLIQPKVECLKVNRSEALSLLNGMIDDNGSGTECSFGSDAQAEVGSKTEVDNEAEVVDMLSNRKIAAMLVEKFKAKKQQFIVIITGSTDVMCTKMNTYERQGKFNFAPRLVGTGCMLGGMIADQLGTAMTLIQQSGPATTLNRTKDNTVNLKESQNNQLLMCSKAVWATVNLMKSVTEEATSKLRGSYEDDVFKSNVINTLCLGIPKVYVITTEVLNFSEELMPRIQWLLAEGIDYLQYRNKNKPRDSMIDELKRLKAICLKYAVPLIVNDHVDLAFEVAADGVHLGNTDSTAESARKILGDTAIIGATVKTVEQGYAAMINGADYIGIGAIYPSATKQDAMGITLERLREVRAIMTLPMFGIGGITYGGIRQEMIRYLDGIAVVNALLSIGKEKEMVTELRRIKLKMIYEKYVG